MGLIFSSNLCPKWLITKPHNLFIIQIFWIRANSLQLSIIIITLTCKKWLQYKVAKAAVTSCLASPHRQIGFDWRSVMAFHSSSVWDGAPDWSGAGLWSSISGWCQTHYLSLVSQWVSTWKCFRVQIYLILLLFTNAVNFLYFTNPVQTFPTVHWNNALFSFFQ